MKNLKEKLTENKVKIGIVACASQASNTGSITAKAALELAQAFGDQAGICSLPAIATDVPRQTFVVKSLPTLLVIDGCHNECAKKILAQAGLSPSLYVNLDTIWALKRRALSAHLAFKKMK